MHQSDSIPNSPEQPSGGDEPAVSARTAQDDDDDTGLSIETSPAVARSQSPVDPAPIEPNQPCHLSGGPHEKGSPANGDSGL